MEKEKKEMSKITLGNLIKHQGKVTVYMENDECVEGIVTQASYGIITIEDTISGKVFVIPLTVVKLIEVNDDDVTRISGIEYEPKTKK